VAIGVRKEKGEKRRRGGGRRKAKKVGRGIRKGRSEKWR